MPRGKKTVAADVKAVEKTEVAAEIVEAAPAEEKTEKKAAAKAPKAKKSADIATKVVIELMEKSADSSTLIERAKADWVAKGNTLEDVKDLALYINASEGMVYYVVNDDYLSGSFAF